MTLYRLIPHLPEASAQEQGGALFVQRAGQGQGRHDNPDLYGALYVSREPASAIAELLKHHRGRTVRRGHFFWERGRYALAKIAEDRLEVGVDLDDPAELVTRSLRPSRVATASRDRTQDQARLLFQEGVPGFAWWSTIEASWINVTLFAERAAGALRLTGEPEPLSIEHPAVASAAEALGLTLG